MLTYIEPFRRDHWSSGLRKDDINGKKYSSKQEFESVEWIENIHPSNIELSYPNILLSLVKISLISENFQDINCVKFVFT